MKKITLLLMMLGFIISTTNLTAQTYFSVAINGGATYVSNPGSFAGYPWGGVPNHSFNNTNSKNISVAITGYDETNAAVGSELFINFSRVGFGNGTLGWGSDNFTNLMTLTPSDFTAGAATVEVDIPGGTLPVAQTADFVDGYLYILQVVGANPSTNQTYINYVVDIEEELVLNTNSYNNKLKSSFYNATKDAIVLSNDATGDYKIYDLTGKTIMQGELSKEVSVSILKSGIYILKTDKGILKFVK